MSGEWHELTPEERELGMDRPITRRDFLDGMAVGIGGLVAGSALGGVLAPGAAAKTHWPHEHYYPRSSRQYYPPSRTGLRGQFDLSGTIPHALRDGSFWPRAGRVHQTREHYDLVVVGGGISGLTAAFLYRQQAGPNARILVLEALDDFGGHARRNEFVSRGGRFMIGYGGAQSIDGPSGFPAEVLGTLKDIGVELERWYPQSAAHPDGRGYFDSTFNARNGFTANRWTYFDRETFAADKLVARPTGQSTADFAANTPLHPQARQQLVDLETKDYFPGWSQEAKRDRLLSLTYKGFLEQVVHAHPDVARYFHKRPAGEWALGIDSLSALDCAGIGVPVGTGVTLDDDPRLARVNLRTGDDPYIFHFPEGNGGVARLLVRGLVPQAFPGVPAPVPGGETMERAELTHLDYRLLDDHRNAARIRLGSPVVRVRHLGRNLESSPVEVAYVRDSERLESITADACVLATYHTMMPYILEGLSAAQSHALHDNVRLALMYSNVQIRNRDAFRAMKTTSVSFPGNAMIYNSIGLDFPVSLGGYAFPPAGNDDACILHCSSAFYAPDSGLDPRTQARRGRGTLVGLSFRDLERRLRDQMARGFAAGGFDPARDIEAITLNRWAHGYAYEYIRPWDTFWPGGPLPNVIARQRFGRVAIAASDSGATAYTDEAIYQAHRAIGDLAGLPATAMNFRGRAVTRT